MSDYNGFRIEYPPVVPPASGEDYPYKPKKTPEPPKEEEPKASYGWGYLGDLICWWRTRRERQLVERIRELEQQVTLLREETWQQGLLIDRMSKQNQLTNLAMAHQLRAMGAPPAPDHEPKPRERK